MIAILKTTLVTCMLMFCTCAKDNPSMMPGVALLATFNGTFDWSTLNDPVMGGKSFSTFETSDQNIGIFKGYNAIVPQLSAPGFCYIRSTGPMDPFFFMLNNMLDGEITFPDVSAFINGSFFINVSSSTPQYEGFKLAFLAQGVPASNMFTAGSFKTDFRVKAPDTWEVVEIPVMSFSWDWSPYTGRCDTKDPDNFGFPGRQHKCCESPATTPDLCPVADYLAKVTGLEIWAEGVEGDFELKLDWIGIGNQSPSQELLG